MPLKPSTFNVFWPRQYPQGFAEEIRRLYPGVVTGAEGMPEVDPTASPEAEFAKMTFSTWQEAKLVGTLRYLRGNKHLKLPETWQNVFPKPLEILHKVEQRAQS